MTPQLRFPEFTDDWQAKRLGDVSDFFDEKRVPIESAQRQAMQGVYPYYGASGVIDYVNDYIFDGEYILLAEDGANILMRSTPVAFIARGKFWLNNHAHIMKAHDSNTFLATCLERIRYDSYNTGTAQPKLNAAIVKKVKITIPLQSEQQKIADFLAAVDDKIISLDKKVGLLKQYKKGVMRQIFSQQVRLKDDNTQPYPHWEQKKLGDIATIKTGDLNVQDATTNGRYSFFDRSEEIKLYDRYSFDNEAIIYTGEGSEFLPRYFRGKYGLHQRAYTIFNAKNVDMRFLYSFLLTQNNHFLRMAVGSTVKSLRMACFTECTIPVPVLAEQQKIARLLTGLDDKITAEQKRLSAAKEWKKGLIQRMFI